MVDLIWYAAIGVVIMYWLFAWLLSYLNKNAMPWEKLTLKTPIVVLGMLGHAVAIAGIFV